LADESSIIEMKGKYEKGGYGYGHAKQELYELIVEKFKNEREKFNHLIEHRNEIDEALEIGAQKARVVAQNVLRRVRVKAGYNA
jgi:tryptophanyl-tRNA synthetase